MAVRLREYQEDMERKAGASLRRVQRTLLQLSPGGGKTQIANSMAAKFATRQAHVWFICHRDELIHQTSLTFTANGLAHSYIASGYACDLAALVHICSIETLKLRLATLTAPRLAIIDEAHHSGAAGWAMVIEWLTANGAYIVGLTGTPIRHDGSGLDGQYDELIIGPSTAWLMEQEYLSQYELYAPDKPSMKGIKNLGSMPAARRMSEPKLTGNIIAHYKEHASGLVTVGFGVNVAHSEYLAEQFRGKGIRAVHLDGKTRQRERRAMIKDIGPGGIEVVFNVGLFGEGFDLSAIAQRDITIDAVIDAGPSESLSWCLQKIMRCMRPRPGKVGIILDHANNSDKHGFPDDPQHWSLKGREKGVAANDNGPPPPMTCTSCFRQVRQPAPDCCPTCGAALRTAFVAPAVADGILRKQEESDKRANRERRAAEQAACKDLGSLVAFFQKQGSKTPMQQAQKAMSKIAAQKMCA